MVQIIIMRLGVALRTASMEDRKMREARAKQIYARHGKMNKRYLFTVYAFENISLDSTLNPKLYIYISYQAGKQASKLGLI